MSNLYWLTDEQMARLTALFSQEPRQTAGGRSARVEWDRFRQSQPAGAGEMHHQRITGRTRCVNNAAAAIDAAQRGHGLIRARTYQVAAAIATGRLVRLLPHFEQLPTPAHIVFHPGRAKRGALWAFNEHAVPTLKGELREIE